MNKVCLITGCNTGIGKETAIGLAQNGYKVLMLVRDTKKSEVAFKDIKTISKNDSVEMFFADLSLQSSIRTTAKEIITKHKVIDVLINNAGLMKREEEITKDGIESTVAVNYFATFLLTNLMLPVIEKSKNGRIINVSSELYKNGKIDIGNFTSSTKFNGSKAYASSKLMVAFFTKELSKRLNDKKITVNCVHPGVIGSDVFREYPKIVNKLLNLFISNTKEGAKPSIYLATSKEVEGITGKYFYKTKEKPFIKTLDDNDLSKKIWEESLKITNLKT